MKIRYCGDPVLRKKAKKVKQVDDDLRALMADMVETMLEAPGVGLAAPQVGVSLRAICVRVPEDREAGDEGDAGDQDDEAPTWCLINPVIIKSTKETAEVYEGCLSLPSLTAVVERPSEVVVQAYDLEGREVTLEAAGLLARALQHEIDHLRGVLFIDRCDRDTLAWMVPDESDERGYHLDSTTLQEALERFERLRQQEEPQ